jgi:hypothetical protein
MSLRLMTLRWLLALAAVVAATLILLSPGGAVVTEPVVSVDTDPTDNTATFVATIDPCREVTVDPLGFDIDVTIEQVTDLAGFEAKLDYNPAVLKVTGVDYSYFLATAGSVTNWGEAPTSLNPDTDGTLSMVATLSIPLPATGATGEGVLARVSLEAVANGLSELNLNDIKLADINTQPIGDEDDPPDQIFDGPVNHGQIAVAQPCSTPTPAPPVGGMAELPDAPASSGRNHIALAGLTAAALLALTAGAWYAGRRWLR